MDQIVCRYIFSRSRRRRWWPFSPVVAGTHESAQRPASHPRTDETKPKPIGQTKIGFSDFHHSTKHIESINICSEGKKVFSNVVQWKTFMSSGKEENKPVQNHCKYTCRGNPSDCPLGYIGLGWSVVKEPTVDKLFRCRKCDFLCTRLAQLNIHIRVHIKRENMKKHLFFRVLKKKERCPSCRRCRRWLR